MRKKKTVFGSVFVLVLMLLLPCISAVHQSSIKEEYRKEIMEQLESSSIDHLDLLEGIKHPVLFIVIYLRLRVCHTRIDYLFNTCIIWMSFLGTYINKDKYILAHSLIIRANTIHNFWEDLSDKFGWNWDLPYYCKPHWFPYI